MSLTYAQLTQAIKDYTQVDEVSFNNNIPNFVQNTETLINNSVQLPAFRKNVTGETTANWAYISLPNDFLSVFSVAIARYTTPFTYTPPLIGPYSYLLQKDVNYIREAFPYPESVGLPTHYAIFNNSAFIVGPTPDDCYPVELHYYAQMPSIVTTGTSWLGNNFPNVLLWGSLVEAYIYVKGEQDLIQQYQNKFQEALAPLKQLGDGKDRQDNYRTTQVRDQVT